jgi:response regulator NasT
MERHSIDDQQAYELLREHSRINNRKLVDLATAIVDGHRLLPKQLPAPPQPPATGDLLEIQTAAALEPRT